MDDVCESNSARRNHSLIEFSMTLFLPVDVAVVRSSSGLWIALTGYSCVLSKKQ